MAKKMEQDLLKLIKGRKVTFFVGAGISMIPPSCLPSWWQINHAILDALAEEANSMVSGFEELADLIKNREDEGKLPPEFVSELITRRLGESYFDVLKCLEGDMPNKIHLWLATLAKAGLVNAIITTNFDTLIERAFKVLDVPVRVLVEPEEFQSAINHNSDICILLKLHGTATVPKTCIDTLAQRKKGLHPSKMELLQMLGNRSTWLILGYSGADIDAEPNYLGIRGRKDSSPGFYWLNLPGKQPIAAVADLVNYYGNNQGKIVYGELPSWFDNVNSILPRKGLFSRKIGMPKELPLSEDQIAKIKQESTQKIHDSTKKWADERQFLVSGLILADIAIQAGFREESEVKLRQFLDLKDENELSDLANGLLFEELGDILQHFAKNRESYEYYQKSFNYYKQANKEDGVVHAARQAGSVLLHMGYFTEAGKFFQGYLDYAREKNEPESLVDGLYELAKFYKVTGKYKETLDLLKEAIPIAVENGLEVYNALCLIQKATAEGELGEPQQALEDLLKVISIYSRLGDQGGESEALRMMANYYLDQGKIQEGLQKLSEATDKAIKEGDKLKMLLANKVKAEFLAHSGKYAEAESMLSETAQQAEDLSEYDLAINTWLSAGVTLQTMGNYDTAWTLFQNVLKLAEDHGQEVSGARVKMNMGIVAEQKGDLNTAIDLYQQASSIFERCQNVEAIAQAKGNIGNIFYRQGNYSQAKINYEETIPLFEQLGYVDMIITTLTNLANVSSALGEIDQAKEYYIHAMQKAEQFQKEGLRDNIKFNYANVLAQNKEFDEALALYETTYSSCIQRQDFFWAGLTGFYAGLNFSVLEDKELPIRFLKQAFSAWDQLKEQPPQYAQARELLQKLEQND